MKRLSGFVLLLMFALFSCNDKSADSKSTASGSSANTDKQKELLEANHAVQRAIETGDSATLRKYISTESVDHGGAPDGGDVKGDDIVKMLAAFHKDVDNLKFEVIEEAASDDHVFCHVRMTGTTNKAVWGMPAGHKMDYKSVDVIKVKDGKMTDHWAYFEMAEVMKMMGSSGAGGAPAQAIDSVR